MFVSKAMYVIGMLALSYLCGRIVRIFEDDMDSMNPVLRFFFTILIYLSIPGVLLVGCWLDALIDSDDDRR